MSHFDFRTNLNSNRHLSLGHCVLINPGEKTQCQCLFQCHEHDEGCFSLKSSVPPKQKTSPHWLKQISCTHNCSATDAIHSPDVATPANQNSYFKPAEPGPMSDHDRRAREWCSLQAPSCVSGDWMTICFGFNERKPSCRHTGEPVLKRTCATWRSIALAAKRLQGALEHTWVIAVRQGLKHAARENIFCGRMFAP